MARHTNASMPSRGIRDNPHFEGETIPDLCDAVICGLQFYLNTSAPLETQHDPEYPDLVLVNYPHQYKKIKGTGGGKQYLKKSSRLT